MGVRNTGACQRKRPLLYIDRSWRAKNLRWPRKTSSIRSDRFPLPYYTTDTRSCRHGQMNSFNDSDSNETVTVVYLLNQSSRAILASRLIMQPPSQSDIPEHEEQFMVYSESADNYLKYLTVTGTHAPILLQIVLTVFGLLGSLISGVVFSRPQMASSIYTLLASVEFANFFIYLTFIPDLVRVTVREFALSRESVAIFKATTYVQIASILISNWTLVLVTFWRYVGIRWPTKAYNWCSRSRCHLALALVFSLSVILAVPASVIFTAQEVKYVAYDQGTKSYYSSSVFRPILSEWALMGGGFLMTFSKVILLLATTVPCVILTITTAVLVKTLVSTHKAKCRLFNLEDAEKYSSRRISLMVVASFTIYARFLVSYFPDSVANVVAFFEEPDHIVGPDHLNLFRERIFIMMANSFNFFTNYFLSDNFRVTFVNLFRLNSFKICCRHHSRSSDSPISYE